MTVRTDPWIFARSSCSTTSADFFILFTHVILAALIVPMALVTLSRALREPFDRHASLTRWTLPLWLYVSLTGVIAYLMIYRIRW
jgi:uncharacterized membrane protein YozB (DUF420 family)